MKNKPRREGKEKHPKKNRKQKLKKGKQKNLGKFYKEFSNPQKISRQKIGCNKTNDNTLTDSLEQNSKGPRRKKHNFTKTISNARYLKFIQSISATSRKKRKKLLLNAQNVNISKPSQNKISKMKKINLDFLDTISPRKLTKTTANNTSKEQNDTECIELFDSTIENTENTVVNDLINTNESTLNEIENTQNAESQTESLKRKLPPTDDIQIIDDESNDCVIIDPNIPYITIDDEPVVKDYITVRGRLVTSTPLTNKKAKKITDKCNYRIDVTRIPSYDLLKTNGYTEKSTTENEIIILDDINDVTINEQKNICDKLKHYKNTNNYLGLENHNAQYSFRRRNNFHSLFSNVLRTKTINRNDHRNAFRYQNTNDFPCTSTKSTPICAKKTPLFPFLSTETQTSHKGSNELLTLSEKKQLMSCSRTPRASSGKLRQKRMVIVDGSNVAFHYSLKKEFSVKGLKICLEYFEKLGHEVKAIVPQYRVRTGKSSDPKELEKLYEQGKVVFTPCKNLPSMSKPYVSSYDDRFVLQFAGEFDAAIVSNDSYRDLVNENSAFKKLIENRVIGYTWCNDVFILPTDPYGRWGPSLEDILYKT